MMSDEYPHGCFYAIGLETFAIEMVEVVEFDNHSLLGEGVGGGELDPHA